MAPQLNGGTISAPVCRRIPGHVAVIKVSSSTVTAHAAAQPVVIRLADHFDGGESPLTYSVTTDTGFAAATIDPAGLLTIKASSLVQPGFTTVSDNLVVRATSTINTYDFREAAFTVYQKTPTRFANAMVATSRADAWLTQTQVGTGWSQLLSPRVVARPSAVVATHAGDFDADGGSDLAGRNHLTGTWRMLQDSGTRFDRPRVIGTWTTPSQGGSSGTIQVTHDPATTNQIPTSGTLVLSGNLALSGAGTLSGT